ncbi:MAG: hypothetical protein DRO04_01830 [Candidatus Iainarchaeum archaeon]|uniref:Phosphatidic acid phosphatase type 2/haloperoxidase domain-containing protein n=1 Tax=Candidatus Iainarchaeum sp. TaxID=3101447 RepID=A0A497JKK4_9ARCH|nr:MAG: hypothetical protein DRO04_01830 [Candidatus Diapherotrites archaeon]
MIQWDAINAYEKGAILFLQQFQNPVLNTVMKGLSFFGNPIFWFFVAAFLYWRGKKILALYCINVIVVASAASGFLKSIFARPRPNLAIYNAEWFGIKEGASFSFPSGHSTLAGAFASFFKDWKLFALAAVVAFTRVFLGMHYISDVVFGLCLGSALGYFAARVKKKMPESFVISIKKEFVLLSLVLVLCLISLVFFNKLPLLGSVLGFYAGFVVELCHKPKEMSISKIGIGFLGLLGISFLALFFNGLLQFVIFFLAGLWVSFIWPNAERKI